MKTSLDYPPEKNPEGSASRVFNAMTSRAAHEEFWAGSLFQPPRIPMTSRKLRQVVMVHPLEKESYRFVGRGIDSNGKFESGAIWISSPEFYLMPRAYSLGLGMSFITSLPRGVITC